MLDAVIDLQHPDVMEQSGRVEAVQATAIKARRAGDQICEASHALAVTGVISETFVGSIQKRIAVT